MDGKTARAFVHQLVRSAIRGNNVVNKKKTYDLLHLSALEFVRMTRCITSSQDITTVADQASYDLESNFLSLYLKTDDPRGGDYFVKYTDSSSVEHMITWASYQYVVYSNQTTSVALPNSFTIHDKSSLPTKLTGTTTSAGSESGGEANLTDTGEEFETYVNAGDIVHNSSKDYSGIVLSVTDDENLVTAMFDDVGDSVGWGSGESWVIQPGSLLQLQLDPPPETASETVTVSYVAKPDPVYSNYGTWRIPDIYHGGLCYKAAHIYLMEMLVAPEALEVKVDIKLSDIYLTEWLKTIHQAKHEIDKSLGKRGYSMRMKS